MTVLVPMDLPVWATFQRLYREFLFTGRPSGRLWVVEDGEWKEVEEDSLEGRLLLA